MVVREQPRLVMGLGPHGGPHGAGGHCLAEESFSVNKLFPPRRSSFSSLISKKYENVYSVKTR